MNTTLKEIAITAWACDKPDREAITLNCLQRIADATEAMAKRHTEIIEERDGHKADSDYYRQVADIQSRRISALRGVITKLKRKQGGKP